MGMLASTIIIGDTNAAPNLADQEGQATAQDNAVRVTIEILGRANLTANLEGQPSHFPHQTDAAPSGIDICYGDPTTIIRAEAQYGPLPLGPTGHRPLHIRLTIPKFPPSPPEDADQGLPPPRKMPPTARQTSLVPISQGHRPRPMLPTRPHRPTHSHAHSRRRLRFPATTPA